MGWEISPQVKTILDKARDFAGISHADARLLLNLDLDCKETYALMETAHRLSRDQFRGKGENHLHIGVNVEPCPYNCRFCSLAADAEIFTRTVHFSEEEILGWAKMGAAQSADGLNVMTAGTFSFERLGLGISWAYLVLGELTGVPNGLGAVMMDALFPWLTVHENIAFGLRGQKQDKRSRAHQVERFLGLVGLSEFRDYLPRALSGGMKQRVALARVLILQPQVLLMDEPFASLDAQSREEMQNLLLSLWQELGHTILFVTHDVSEAVILADRILLMDKSPGRIREEIWLNLLRPRERESGALLDFSRRLHQALRD